MKKFLGSLLAVAFAMSVGTTAAFATTASTKCAAGQTYTKAYTKADGTKVAGYCSTKGTKSAAAMPAAASTAAASSMKSAQHMTSSATKTTTSAAGGAMSGAAMTSKNAMGAMSCPTGKTYVNGYTKKDGTKVAGYCRSKPSK